MERKSAMISNQSNQSNQPLSNWIDKIWYVEEVNTNNLGVSAPDAVTFANMTTGTMVQILSSGLSQNLVAQTSSQPAPWPWGTLQQSSVAASMSSQSSSVRVTGQTTWGQPFHIDYPYNGDPKKLACYIDKPSNQISWTRVALGAIAGTLLGAAVGFAARSPVVGALAGQIAATTGSLITARGIPTAGSYHPVQGGGSTPTWVANDGPSGRPGRPGPHPVDEATA
jgi:hypothetical protein